MSPFQSAISLRLIFKMDLPDMSHPLRTGVCYGAPPRPRLPPSEKTPLPRQVQATPARAGAEGPGRLPPAGLAASRAPVLSPSGHRQCAPWGPPGPSLLAPPRRACRPCSGHSGSQGRVGTGARESSAWAPSGTERPLPDDSHSRPCRHKGPPEVPSGSCRPRREADYSATPDRKPCLPAHCRVLTRGGQAAAAAPPPAGPPGEGAEPTRRGGDSGRSCCGRRWGPSVPHHPPPCRPRATCLGDPVAPRDPRVRGTATLGAASAAAAWPPGPAHLPASEPGVPGWRWRLPCLPTPLRAAQGTAVGAAHGSPPGAVGPRPPELHRERKHEARAWGPWLPCHLLEIHISPRVLGGLQVPTGETLCDHSHQS